MSRRSQLLQACLPISLVVAGAAAVALAAPDAPAQTSVEELQRQIAALQQRVTELESRQVPAEQVDATVRRVIEDADRRSRVVDASQIQAGWDPKLEKFVLRSADGNFSISPTLIWQFRGVADFRDDPAGANTNGTEAGFENRRVRAGMEGNFASKDLTYKFLWETNRDGGSFYLLDAYAKYKLNADWAVRAGQFIDFWDPEENVAPARQLAVERSELNALVGGAFTDRVQGVALSYERAKPWRAQIAVHDGANSKNTPYTDGPPAALPPLAASESFGVTGRLEYFAMGTPKQYEDYTALGNTTDLLVFGAGSDWTQGGDNDAIFHVADVQYENARGLGLYAEYMGLARNIGTGSSTVGTGNFYDYGFLVQASYLFAPKWEVFGRYDWTQLDAAAFTASRVTRQTQVQEMTVGLNYYLYKHNAKFTVDLSYLPDGSPECPGLGYLATEGDEVVLRTQLQLAL